ncbi:DUF1501 domain-containing protein [Undibacterium sp. LX40W]|uniref:DUF1501 domain-containing protein n=1 Tax=Undibacterium nitidum TaxID=2762298 RepID=A0A923KT70_9BURK|nr:MULTISPECIES: DUF1501 domain-containing protein [Undibacterium]MBC3881971.1 DUF1501 domain-containing protein [Undibacterium nitidum]MBC3892033.1 DUF1501 domain-containing protein [Undibacterium sp. LX40W]
MNRRELLKSIGLFGAGVGLSTISAQLLAAPATQNRLLFVFLRGGYDASNLLVPTSSQFYYDARPTISIAKPSADVNSALELNADWGLHPALRDTIYPMFKAGEASFIPFAGTDDLSRSHFETQDSIEMGQDMSGTRNYQSGFLNRLAAQLNSGMAMSFTDQLPIIMRGDTKVANTALRTISKSNMDDKQSKIIAQMYNKTGLEKQVNDGFEVRGEVVRDMQAEMQNNDGNRNAITTKGFELEAKRIAKMMRDKYALGFIDVGGWDTHVNQGGASGALAGKFEELGRGLAAYKNEMGAMWKNTTVVVISEFGRTFRENGKRGTDHGHGSVYWVLGGGIKGGRVLGEQVKLEAASLFQNRDYPVLNEYRAVLGGIFAGVYGLNSQQLDQVFAGVKARDLGLV